MGLALLEDEELKKLAQKYRPWPYQYQNAIVTNEIWTKLFTKGILDEEEVQNSIYSCRLLSQQKPTWMKLRDVWALTDDDLEELLCDLKKNIEHREFSRIGEILHVTGILLWLSKKNLHVDTPENITSKMKKLLDHIKKNEKLSPEALNDENRINDRNTFNGFFYGI